MATITFEQLAEKLNGKIWTKGDLKRIYLDRGYNTKKMSTKTYVEEVDGEFVVKCFIDCPSQAWNWIKSQQEEVIESVEKNIEEIIVFESLPEETQSISEVKIGYLDEVTGSGAHSLYLFGLTNFLNAEKEEWVWLCDLELYSKEKAEEYNNQITIISIEDVKYFTYSKSGFGYPIHLSEIDYVKIASVNE